MELKDFKFKNVLQMNTLINQRVNVEIAFENNNQHAVLEIIFKENSSKVLDILQESKNMSLSDFIRKYGFSTFKISLKEKEV